MTQSKLLLLECPCLQLSAVARFSDGSIAEPDIPLVITIEDENDNPPFFELHSGNITERSKKGMSTFKAKKRVCPAEKIFFICLIDQKDKQSKVHIVMRYVIFLWLVPHRNLCPADRGEGQRPGGNNQFPDCLQNPQSGAGGQTHVLR